MILDSNFSKKKLRGEIREGVKKMAKFGTSTGQDRTGQDRIVTRFLMLQSFSISRGHLVPWQGSVLHLSVFLRSGQGAPQCCASSKTALVVFLVPLPQVTLQALQGSQSPTLQSTSYRIRRRSFFQYEGDSICIYTLTLLGVAPLCDL